jgi:hypothetical protein
VKLRRPKGFKHASDALREAVDGHDCDDLAFGDLMKSLKERGFGLLMIIFALPNCVPVPVPPGVSTIISIPLLLLSVQMLMGLSSPWLPGWVARKTIKRKTLANMVSTFSPKLKWFEKFLKSRMMFASTRTGESVVGGIIIIFSLSISLPLPMTNFLPGVGTVLMSLGLLGKDGVMILIGMLVGFIGLAITAAILLLGHQAVFMLLPG